MKSWSAKMVMSLNDMRDVAEKLFSDAATICYRCSRRYEPGRADVPCPESCGALQVHKSACNIVDEIDHRNRVIRDSWQQQAPARLRTGTDS